MHYGYSPVNADILPGAHLSSDGYVLFWQAPKAKKPLDEAHCYVVYRFAKGEKVKLEETDHILAITPNTFLNLPYDNGKQKWTYVVTALDRMQNEGKGAKKTVKL